MGPLIDRCSLEPLWISWSISFSIRRRQTLHCRSSIVAFARRFSFILLLVLLKRISLVWLKSLIFRFSKLRFHYFWGFMLRTVRRPPSVVACNEFIVNSWYLICIWRESSILPRVVLLGSSLTHRVVLTPLSITRLLLKTELL